MPLQQLTNLILKVVFSMMFGLVGDVRDKSLNKLGRPFRAGHRLRIAPRAKAPGLFCFPPSGEGRRPAYLNAYRQLPDIQSPKALPSCRAVTQSVTQKTGPRESFTGTCLLTAYCLLLRKPLFPVFSVSVDVILGDWNQLTLHERRRRVLVLGDFVVEHIHRF